MCILLLQSVFFISYRVKHCCRLWKKILQKRREKNRGRNYVDSSFFLSLTFHLLFFFLVFIMLTLETLGWNLLFGCCITIASLIGFGWAVESGDLSKLLGWKDHIAPRISARPRSVLHNVLQPFRQSSSCFCHCLSWIPWSLHLSYQELLDGIPGTGTRENGWKGPTLNCNLDGIILLKFHVLGFKVAMLSTLLSLSIVLPMNWTSPCDYSQATSTSNTTNTSFSENVTYNEYAFNDCQSWNNRTNYERTTLANIPSVSNAKNAHEYFLFHVHARLYAVVLVAIAIYIYVCGK